MKKGKTELSLMMGTLRPPVKERLPPPGTARQPVDPSPLSSRTPKLSGSGCRESGYIGPAAPILSGAPPALIL